MKNGLPLLAYWFLLSYCWSLVIGPSLGLAHQYGSGDNFGYTNVNRYWDFQRVATVVGYWPTNLAYGQRTVFIPDVGDVTTEISFWTNRFDPLVASNTPLQNFDLTDPLPHYRGHYNLVQNAYIPDYADEPAWSGVPGSIPGNISAYYNTVSITTPTNIWSVNLFLYPVLAITNDTYQVVSFRSAPPSGWVTNTAWYQQRVLFVDPWGATNLVAYGDSRFLTNGFAVAFKWTNTVASYITFSNSFLIYEAYTNMVISGGQPFGVGLSHINKVFFNYWDVALYSVLNRTTHMLADPFWNTNVVSLGSNYIGSISLYGSTVTFTDTTASPNSVFKIQHATSLTGSFSNVHTNISDSSGNFLASFNDPTPSGFYQTNIFPPGWYTDGGFNPFYQSGYVTNIQFVIPPVFYRFEL